MAIRNLVKNSKLAKSISDAGWGQFGTMLKYKSEWEGRIYSEIDRFFPSSKTCSNCLHLLNNLTLDIRSWQCPKCQTVHDRDINAAMNIREEGLRLLAGGHLANASFQRVRPSKGTAFIGNVG
jgi:putative transposase